MIIYEKSLANYVEKLIIPNLLLANCGYNLKGTFKRKAPYVTDIDIFARMCLEKVNDGNIYELVTKKIDYLSNTKFKFFELIVAYVTCGNDNRFSIGDEYTKDIERIIDLVDDNDKIKINNILEKYSNDQRALIYHVRDVIWDKYYKLRWTVEEIKNNEKDVAGNIQVTLTDILKENSMINTKYYVTIKNDVVGFDVLTPYKRFKPSPTLQRDLTEFYVNQSNYSNEVYYMLFPLRRYFFDKDEKLYKKIDDIIEKDYGIYKQIMVNIDSYHDMYCLKILTTSFAVKLYLSIMGAIGTIINDGFRSETYDKLKEIPPNRETVSTDIHKWARLFAFLYRDIDIYLNKHVCGVYNKFLLKVPENDRPNVYLKYAKGETVDCERMKPAMREGC